MNMKQLILCTYPMYETPTSVLHKSHLTVINNMIIITAIYIVVFHSRQKLMKRTFFSASISWDCLSTSPSLNSARNRFSKRETMLLKYN